MEALPRPDHEIHHVKIKKEYAAAIMDGRKRFEIRLNDRDYKVGDLMILRPWHPERGYLPFFPIVTMITFLTDFEQKEGYVVLGIKVFRPEEKK